MQVECFMIWVEMIDQTRSVHMVVGSEEEAQALVHRCMNPVPASCRCCEDPGPASVLGIRKMWIERRAFTVVDRERGYPVRILEEKDA